MAMKCIVQMPEPMAAEPRASQPARQDWATSIDLVVQRSPSAPPRKARKNATSGVTIP